MRQVEKWAGGCLRYSRFGSWVASLAAMFGVTRHVAQRGRSGAYPDRRAAGTEMLGASTIVNTCNLREHLVQLLAERYSTRDLASNRQPGQSIGTLTWSNDSSNSLTS